jgi:hypothetical protein
MATASALKAVELKTRHADAAMILIYFFIPQPPHPRSNALSDLIHAKIIHSCQSYIKEKTLFNIIITGKADNKKGRPSTKKKAACEEIFKKLSVIF